jgi:uncharacterized repeat protein (TIGR01451 family)
MKKRTRLPGLLLLAAGAIVGARSALAWPGPQTAVRQPDPPQSVQPLPPPPGPVPPGAPGLPPPGALPQAILPPQGPPAQLPGVPATPTPGAAKEPAAGAGASIKDIVIEPGAGPTQANPTNRQEPSLSLEWIAPATAKLGQPVTCQIIVRSLSTARLHQVVLRARIPADVTVKATEPKGGADGEVLVWELGTMEAREERRIDLLLVPTAKTSLALNAYVTFTGTSTARLDIREPRLTLKAQAPTRVITGDPATVTLTVSNPGDATAEMVRVKATLTDGLEHGRGQTVEFNLDTLGPKESRTVLVTCSAKTVGPQTCTAVATAEPGLSAQDTAAIEIVAPRLDVAVTGPGMRYLDRHAVIHFKVTNPGTATANHVSLTDQVPPGFRVLSASEGGRHDFVSRAVVWFLGDLPPGRSKEVDLELVAINPGEHKNKAVVTAARGLHADAEVCTRVEGLPALLMELVDLDDPIEVGKETAYEIHVTNTGTKTETNLQVTCTLPEQMEFRAAQGAGGCAFKTQGREVAFEPVAKLAPRADAIYRVKVRCVAPGDVRFQARMRADGLSQPVLREESTRIYGDEADAPAAPKQ